jgi:hypothetical protein
MILYMAYNKNGDPFNRVLAKSDYYDSINQFYEHSIRHFNTWNCKIVPASCIKKLNINDNDISSYKTIPFSDLPIKR